MKCLECRAKFGTPHTLSFHYKPKHKDKIGERKCGDISLSRICLGKFIQEASHPNPNYYFHPNSNSNSNSNPNSESNSNSNCTPSSISKPSPIKLIDLTNKVYNKCNVIKKMTCFDKKEINM